MPKRTATIREIVRTWPEPRRTRTLRALNEGGGAVTLVYRPRPNCPPYRKLFLEIGVGIPEKKFRFDAGKPRAVSIGVAVLVMEQYRPNPGHEVMNFEDSEFVELDGVDLSQLGELPSSVIDQPERALDHADPVRDGPKDTISKDEAPEEDGVDLSGEAGSLPLTPPPAPPPPMPRADDGPAKRIATMTRDDLVRIHEDEIGPVAPETKRPALIRAITDARKRTE